MGYTGEQKREYQRLWLANRRAEYFKDKVCVKCGSDDRLELDHIDRSTKVDHKIWSWSKARMETELAKCQVLCNTCHKVKTRQENVSEAHGISKYRNHGCRCKVCKEAKSVENAKRNASLV